jgi:16S rRNA (guanine1207-N2)-methyltransferase
MATAAANGLVDQVSVIHDDAMSTLDAGSADLVLLNPPFHLGASVHAGAALKMFQAAARVLEPGGELWTVYNSHLHYRPALERLIGPTVEEGRNPKFTVTRSRRG